MREVTGGFGRVRVGLEQGGAARTERSVENYFECPLRETVLVTIQCHPVMQQRDRRRPRCVDRIIDTQFHLAGIERMPHPRDIRQLASRILDFAPAQRDLAFHAGEERFLPLSFGWLWNIFRHESLRVIEQHSGRLAG